MIAVTRCTDVSEISTHSSRSFRESSSGTCWKKNQKKTVGVTSSWCHLTADLNMWWMTYSVAPFHQSSVHDLLQSQYKTRCHQNLFSHANIQGHLPKAAFTECRMDRMSSGSQLGPTLTSELRQTKTPDAASKYFILCNRSTLNGWKLSKVELFQNQNRHYVALQQPLLKLDQLYPKHNISSFGFVAITKLKQNCIF